MKQVSFLKFCLLTVFRPIDCFDIIKRERNKLKIWQPLLLYLIAVIVNYSYIFIVHFPLSGKQPIDANFLIECAMVFVPLLTWSIAAYAITSIMSGESKFVEQFTAYGYSLVPYIVITPVLGVISNLCGYSQAGIYFFFKYIALLWVLVLLFIALMRLNDYSLMKTFAVAFISLLMMVVVWAVVLLLASMTVQLFAFFADVFKEISFKL